MQCLKCGHVNEAGKKFCPKCGVSLAESARVEAEKIEQARLRLDEERKAAVLEQERLEQEQNRKRQLRRERLWGNRTAKIRTIAVGSVVLTTVALIAGQHIVHIKEEERMAARTALLSETVNRNDWDQVRQLVQEGVDPNATIIERDGSKSEFLIKAIFKSNIGDKASLDVATWLIEHGADVNRPSGAITALGIARNPTVVSLLLNHGAAIDFKSSTGETPLFWAACATPEIIDLLLEKHAPVNVQTNYGDTPLHHAVKCGYLADVKALVEHGGADVNLTNQAGKTPLAVSLGHPDIANYLKAHGAIGEAPIQLATLNEQRKNPVYDATFRSLFNDHLDVPVWLSESGYSGVESPGHVVAIGATKLELFVECKPHDCSGNFLHTLFLPGGQAAWALITQNGNDFRFYGNPPAQVQEFLIGESRRNARGEW